VPREEYRRTAPLAKSAPPARACTSSSYACAASTSSLSTKARNSPWATGTATLRAALSPALACEISWNRGSAAANSSATAALASVLPSSTISTCRLR
jgi:hypothetical protein